MLKILLVDDNLGDQKLFKEAIQETDIDHQLSFASSAQECMTMVSSQKPDFIFMDVIMPGLMGGDFVRVLHKDIKTRSIPVVFLTGMVDRDQKGGLVNKLNIGGVFYPALGKPVTPEGIREIVRILSIKGNERA